MLTKADRERRKRDKKEQAERNAELAIEQATCDVRASALQPLVTKHVSYYYEGWRVGTLASIASNKRIVSISPLKTPWMKTAPKNVRLPILDVKPIEA